MTTCLLTTVLLVLFVAFRWIPANGAINAMLPTVCDPEHPLNSICQEKNAECTFMSSKENASCSCRNGYEMYEGICEISDAYCMKNKANVTYTGSSVICDCGENNFFDYSTSHCHVVDLCPFISCKGRFEECKGSKCICKTGYERSDDVCRPKNYCLIDSICGDAKCKPGPDEDPKRVTCFCESGSVLIREKSKMYCKLIRCEVGSLNACDQLCSYTPDGKNSKCGCFPGHFLKLDGITCEIFDHQKCTFNSCPPEAVCVEDNGKKTCYCKSGFINDNNTCVDFCSAGKQSKEICPSECKSTADGFQCVCTGKYRISSNEITCEEMQMCAIGESGFENCRLSNRSCLENPSLKKGYECGECLPGFSLYGQICIEMCSLAEYKEYCFRRGGTCAFFNKPSGKINCKCPPLLTYDDKLGCVFAKYSYTASMRIFNDYQNDNNETLFREESSEGWFRLNRDISTSLTTLFGPAVSKVNIINCRADDPVLICKIEMQMKFPDRNLLRRLMYQEMCKKGQHIPNDFCFIPPFLRLRKDSFYTRNLFKLSSACDEEYGSSICSLSTQCNIESIGFSCKCKKGFEANSNSMYLSRDGKGEIQMCRDIDECVKGNPCPNGTTCKNTIGDFECACNPGFIQQISAYYPKRNTCVEICDTINCTHGTCSNFHFGGYYCACNEGYTGQFCELPVKENSNVATAFAIFEGIVILLLTLVLIYIFWIKNYQCGGGNTNDKKRTTRKNISSPLQNLNCPPGLNSGIPKENISADCHIEQDDAIYADCEYVNVSV